MRIYVTYDWLGLHPIIEAFGEDVLDISRVGRPLEREEFLAGLRGADAVLIAMADRVDEEALEAAGPQLKIVAMCGVGYDNVNVVAATKRGVTVTNTPGVVTEATGDAAWGLMLAATRRIAEADRMLRSSGWGRWTPRFLMGRGMHGKTLGIYGFGRIGQVVARRAKGFEMRVLYYRRNRLSREEEQALGVEYADKSTMLRESDYISVHCPMTPETRHSFGAAEFKAMKKTAVFVNASRGPVVDEQALVDALQSGEIYAAGLDVYEEEPKVHPKLLECQNVVLMPHIGTSDIETRYAMGELASKNVVARLKGERPPTCVNPELL